MRIQSTASLCVALLFIGFSPGRAVDFTATIQPIFAERCTNCHGPDKQKSGIRLDRRALLLRGGDSGLPALVPGKPAKSRLIELIKSVDPDERMPPKGEPLSDAEVASIEAWIAGGAQWPGQMDQVTRLTTDHWSFQPVRRPQIPAARVENPIDAFLDARLEEAQIEANGPADARSLVRRAAIVLTGLPPTPQRVEQFLAAHATDAERAYGELVDELLASHHFGERWAQHWLDVIRWAETNGSESNLYRKNAWIYRDYIIRAFNGDLPYEQFVREQIAGDQLDAGEATGFLVAGPHVPAATVGREPTAIRQARADRMDEIIQTVGASILGVTVGCARCHNHKFDPITIKDYYSLTAVFQGVEFGGRRPELPDDHPRMERERALHQAIAGERATLRQGAGQWLEDWGGYQQLTFPSTRTEALRIEFASRNVGIDELDVYGPENSAMNLARASEGTTLSTDGEMTKEGNEVCGRANDGEFGTMAWRTALPKDAEVKPWVEIRFEGAVQVNRFRFSSNREYYFETDYLAINTPALPGFKVSALRPDGSWQEVGKTGWAKILINRSPDLKQASLRLHQLIGQLAEAGPRHSFIARFSDRPAPTRILLRGSPENPHEEVVPAGFEVLGGELGLDSSVPDHLRRLRFAEWLVRKEHPLTARVMANRLWHHVFGSGLVLTAGDFGKAGATPTHPELLDWLAAEFVEPSRDGTQAWSVKSMIRLLVMSDAFRRSSQPDDTGIRVDPGSTLLWRYPPRRVEAEVIRDGILQASGKLDRRIGGRSFRIHNVKKTYAQWQVIDNHGPQTWRRMIYQERMRRVDDKMFTAFDFPDCGQVRAKRPVSTTPLQALNLMNSDFVIEQASFVAERARREAGEDKAAGVRRVFELLLGRPPHPDELSACLDMDLDLALVCRSLINSNEFAFLP